MFSFERYLTMHSSIMILSSAPLLLSSPLKDGHGEQLKLPPPALLIFLFCPGAAQFFKAAPGLKQSFVSIIVKQVAEHEKGNWLAFGASLHNDHVCELHSFWSHFFSPDYLVFRLFS